MFAIKDSDGEDVKCFGRHRGARRYAAKAGRGVLRISIDIRNGFWLSVLFGNATTTKMLFTKYSFLQSFVLNWTAAKGKQLIYNNEKAGTVDSKNSILL